MYTIGVDLGGTQIRAGLFDQKGELLFKAEALTLAQEGAEAVIGRIKKSIREVIGYTGEHTSDSISGIGIGSPGPLNPFTGMVLSPSNLPGMVDIPLQQIIADEFHVPVYLNNDANAAALGEWLYGKGRNTKNMLYITISTGIGAGVIVDGHLLLGEQGSAGEVGHMIIDPQGPLCSCGNYGCFEACASGTGIVQRTREKLARYRREGQTSFSQLQLVEEESLTSKDIFAAAMLNDNLAMEIVEETRTYLGIGLINLINLYNPQKIIIGGGVSKAGDFLLKPSVEMAQQRSLLGIRDVEFSMASLGDNAGLYGAAALVNYHQQLG
ncbi:MULTISPECIES: ROK family protein [unclassified Paenibacillus]|uniref:ROK family protein n=1 Tax=unclassified Paenibacillus TaxID=185978 RepID=UPI003634D58E